MFKNRKTLTSSQN